MKLLGTMVFRHALFTTVEARRVGLCQHRAMTTDLTFLAADAGYSLALVSEVVCGVERSSRHGCLLVLRTTAGCIFQDYTCMYKPVHTLCVPISWNDMCFSFLSVYIWTFLAVFRFVVATQEDYFSAAASLLQQRFVTPPQLAGNVGGHTTRCAFLFCSWQRGRPAAARHPVYECSSFLLILYT